MSRQFHVPHAMTIDAEDWPALMCMYVGHPVPASRQFASALIQLLDLLDQHNLRATFFIVAKHAAEAPDVVREIAARGHEVASHGWTHRKIKSFSPAAFREDVKRSVETLQEITGQKVYGYRAPFFSLMPDQLWAAEAMAEAGLKYDSSLATLLWEKAGCPLPSQPFMFRLPSGANLIEFPIPARKWGPVTVRLIGGRAMRLVPHSISVAHLRQREEENLPGMVYLHSYEVIPGNLASHVPCSVGLGKRLFIVATAISFEIGLGRLRRLLDYLLINFRWAPVRDIIHLLQQAHRLPEVDWPRPCMLRSS